VSPDLKCTVDVCNCDGDRVGIDDDKWACIDCEDGYMLQEDLGPIAISLSAGVCNECGVDHCKECDSVGDCTLCKSGWHTTLADDGQCEENFDHCQATISE